jgi:hypothetical protein
MVRRGGVGIFAALVLTVTVSGTAAGEVLRVHSARRPYITEVGQPYPIAGQALQQELLRISDMHLYVERYGSPDYAEIQEVEPDWPWQPYEVRLYYLDRNIEAVFAAVNLSPAAPNFGVMKFHGDMLPAKRHAIELALQSRLQPAPPRTERMQALVARVEAAAERATQAADRAVAASDAANLAADRTLAIVQKMEQRRRRSR